MKVRSRLVAVLAAAAGLATGLPAVTAAAHADPALEVYVIRHGSTSCQPLTKTITGTILGMDRRLVNAMIQMDIQDASGHAIDGNGCNGSAGYGLGVHVNYTVPAGGAVAGTPDATDAVTAWSVTLPANAAKVYIEVYPQKKSSQPQYGGTDKSRYGFAERPALKLGAGTTGPVKLALPDGTCSQPHAAGTLAGRFLSHGGAVHGVRVSVFSEGSPPSDPLVQGPLGFGIWNGNATGYRIPLLASGSGKGQPYTVIARLADGRSKTFAMKAGGKVKAGVRACKTTQYDIRF